MRRKKDASVIWTLLLGIFFVYLLYQSTYSWDTELSMPKTETVELGEDKTAFLLITNKHYGVKRSSVKAVEESLNMWEYDKKTEKVTLKHESLMPTTKTQMMVIYDRGYDSFERHSDVLSLLKFPYKHHFEEEQIFKVYGVGKDGEVYMSYKNKRIQLKPGESYYTFSTEGWKLTKTVIKNYGIYDKKQFKLSDEVSETGKEEINEPKKVDLREIEIKPLN